jgi:hypothetical protein
MASRDGDLPFLADSDVEALAWQFLNSDYVGDAYATRSLDQRLHNFLRRNGLVRVADDGDLFNIILGRVRAVSAAFPERQTSRLRSAHTHQSPVRRADETLLYDGRLDQRVDVGYHVT